MSDLPSWLVCRPDEGGYARVQIHLRVLSFDHTPQLSALADHVLGMGLHSVLIDMHGVEYLSSDALGGLLHVSRRLRDAGGRVVITNAGPIVRTVFTPFPHRQQMDPNRLAAFHFVETPGPAGA